MKQLLMRHAEINRKNISGLTPLHVAIENNLPKKIIKFLLNNGANKLIRDFNNKTCTYKAL